MSCQYFGTEKSITKYDDPGQAWLVTLPNQSTHRNLHQTERLMTLPNAHKACPKSNNHHSKYLCLKHNESNMNCATSLFDGILGDEYYVTFQYV